MFNYTDMLGQPYEKYGNCYGAIVECCRRAGTPLKNPFAKLKELAAGLEAPYIENINVEEIPSARAGAIVELKNGPNLHVGYMVSNTLVLHSTRLNGVTVTHIAALHPIKFYEVKK